jgi:carbamoylphosphate synthase large subunit
MKRRLLFTGAGTGSGSSLLRSLRAGDPSLFVVGCHADRFVLKKSSADRNYLVPISTHPSFADALLQIIEAEQIDLLIPNSEVDVTVVSGFRDRIPCRLFLPRQALIELCLDKCAFATFLQSRGVPVPVTYPVTDLGTIEELFRKLGSHRRLWCRMRTGTGSMAAIPVTNPEQTRSWIRYWEQMRGVPAASFTLSEYLPGRDYSLQCLWKDGTLILAKMSERLSYFGGGSHPSGVSSTPALAKTVFEPRVVDVCSQAIRALDERASGIFCCDIKENTEGVPCITEINAGRFAMITNIYDLVGKHNMATTFVRLALGEPVEIREEYDVTPDYYLVRDLDTLPGIFHAEELFDGIHSVAT